MERVKRFTQLYESEMNILTEGRGFVAAAKKAKDEGLEEFEWNGKKYPVTLKESLNETRIEDIEQKVKKYKHSDVRHPYAFYNSYSEMEKELAELKALNTPKPHIVDKIEFLEYGIENKVLESKNINGVVKVPGGIKVHLQTYHDGSVSDSYIIVDKITKRAKILDVYLEPNEDELHDEDFVVGKFFDVKDFISDDMNESVNEATYPKVGDNFVHPVYSEIKGKVLVGPDTFEKIEKVGFNMPGLEDLENSQDLNKKVWYGVMTKDNNKMGIHQDEIIKESLVESASKSTVKRKYTENHPSVDIQNYAPIREKVLNFLKENGTVTRAQLKEFLNGMNEDIGSKTSMKWVNKNSRFITEFASKGEVHYKLTPLGKRVVEKMMVKESIDLSYEELNEGQFSWFTQDSHQQIGSERANRIDVYMFDDKGNRWEEKKYDGYGVFGGKDFYDLVAEMNGYTEEDVKTIKGGYKELRQIGINLAFNEGGYKTRHPKGKTLFPALVTNKNYNWKSHDFSKEPENDPNQSWYQEPDEDDNDWNHSW